MGKCRLCGSKNVELLIDFGMQPIVHKLKKDKDFIDEKFPFRLGHCKRCDFLQIMECIAPEILYENYFTLSNWKNQPHVSRLIEVMQSIAGEDYNANILEVGCNDGSFLSVLRDRGYINLHGVEPTKDAYKKTVELGLDVANTFFSKSFVDTKYAKNSFDIVITRQVLEHIGDLEDFMLSMDYVLSDAGKLIIEIPDSRLNIESLDYGLWEEHVNYFTITTLKILLAKYGFRVIHHESTLFSGKALLAFCEKSSNIKELAYENIDRKNILNYKNSWQIYKTNLQEFLKAQTRPIAIYGCGARSSTFVNFTGIAEYIEVFIDDQQEKQNLFLPCANISIQPWDEKYREYVILLGVNTENEYKVITKRALERSRTFSILQPSSLVPKFWKDMIHD